MTETLSESFERVLFAFLTILVFWGAPAFVLMHPELVI